MIFDLFDDDMDRSHMGFLDPVGKWKARYDPFEIAKPFHESPRFAEKRDRLETARRSNLCRRDEILRIAARRKRNKKIARYSERFDSACEDRFESHVVGDAGKMPRICERDRRQGGALLAKYSGQFLGKMDRIAEAAAIAGDEQLPFLLKTIGNPLRRGYDELQSLRLFENSDGARGVFDGLQDLLLHSRLS